MLCVWLWLALVCLWLWGRHCLAGKGHVWDAHVRYKWDPFYDKWIGVGPTFYALAHLLRCNLLHCLPSCLCSSLIYLYWDGTHTCIASNLPRGTLGYWFNVFCHLTFTDDVNRFHVGPLSIFYLLALPYHYHTIFSFYRKKVITLSFSRV